MAANQNPIFTLTPLVAIVQIATANTNRDGTTGTYGTLLTGSSNGDRIESLKITATGTTTVGVVRLFITNKLWAEILVDAVTPSTTVAVFSFVYVPEGGFIDIPSGVVITCSTHNAETFNLHAKGGSY